jgi:hypothetical protein
MYGLFYVYIYTHLTIHNPYRMVVSSSQNIEIPFQLNILPASLHLSRRDDYEQKNAVKQLHLYKCAHSVFF